MGINELKHKYSFLLGKKNQIFSNIREVSKRIESIQNDISTHQTAVEIVKKVAIQTQKQLEYHISHQTSLAMSAIFDEPYQLNIDFVERRGKTEAEIYLEKDGNRFNPLDSVGGGVVDVASLSLRLAFLSLRKDKRISPVLLLDEPLAHLKGESSNMRALQIINKLSEKLGVQIIMVSDERVDREVISQYSDKVFLVTKSNQESVVTELE